MEKIVAKEVKWYYDTLRLNMHISGPCGLCGKEDVVVIPPSSLLAEDTIVQKIVGQMHHGVWFCAECEEATTPDVV